MFILGLKLVLTPLLIAFATLVQRRFGGVVGGLVAGLPLTSAPVSVFLAIQFGAPFASRAAVASLLGSVAMSGFCVAYARAARSFEWPVALTIGALVFGIVGGGLSQLPLDLLPASALAVPALSLAVAVIGQPQTRVRPIAPPTWDLPARMAVAGTAVVLITTFADTLGPKWSGLFATLPVFAGGMGAFSHRHGGAAAAHAVMRGISVGAFGAAAFFITLGVSLPRTGLAVAYPLAAAAALAATAACHALLHAAPSAP